MNRKRFIYGVIILLIISIGIIGFLLLNKRWETALFKNYSTVINEIPKDWQFVDVNSFTLYLPPGWKFNKIQGIDSYVGEFVGDGARLGFDFGWYSNSLPEGDNPDHIATYEMIDGYKAKMVIPKISGQGITGVYFDNLGAITMKTSLNIYGNNLTAAQQENALKIFRSIKFKK